MLRKSKCSSCVTCHLNSICCNWHFVTFEKTEVKNLASNIFVTVRHYETQSNSFESGVTMF